MLQKGMEQGSLFRVTVGECLIPHIEYSFLWFANIEITNDYADGVRIQRPVRVMRRNLSRKRLRVSSGSKWTLKTTHFSALIVHSQYGHGLGK